jgi:alkylation response protein AidB-like acyl-CoA dehydrogenase
VGRCARRDQLLVGPRRPWSPRRQPADAPITADDDHSTQDHHDAAGATEHNDIHLDAAADDDNLIDDINPGVDNEYDAARLGAAYPAAVATVADIAAEWAADRKTRQQRTGLERADFDRLREAGLLKLIAPRESGGDFVSFQASTRSLCDTYRALAAGDPSVALVSSMHPSVIAFWLSTPDASQPAWEEQRQAVFASAVAGEQWGTITSEPGSGGDISRTRSTAAPIDGDAFLPGRLYGVTGDKHFGSGSGITDRMMTTAIPDGEADPKIFVLDVRDRPWDGTAGLTLVAEWDGMGMAATQSHAMHLEGAPAIRMAFDGPIETITLNAGAFVASLFTAVVLGVLDAAVELAREQLRGKADQLRAYEQVQWSRASQDHWLATQAYEGAVRAVEAGSGIGALKAALRAKESVADLAEQTLLRITRVVGGGTYSRRSPFAHWFEDVRALGFLRPPWGLAYDQLFATSFD